MFNFCEIVEEPLSKGKIAIKPKFNTAIRKSDVMTKGGDFLCAFDEETGFWLKDEIFVINTIDDAIRARYNERINGKGPADETKYVPLYMHDSDSGSLDKWHRFVKQQLRDNYHCLDQKIIDNKTKPVREDFVTKCLPYSIEEGECPAFLEALYTWYNEEEADKIIWSIGSIFTGDSKSIQKFLVFYGPPGTGKSSVLDIYQKLFKSYWSTWDSKQVGSRASSFPLESFINEPLVSINSDGDLSRLDDNTTLNSIVSHEVLEMNIKNKSKYPQKFNTMLLVATNKPVKITEAKSGLTRRLIDVHPSGNKIKPLSKYNRLVNQINFELGHIASYCIKKYKEMGIDYYDDYIPMRMISATNDFYEFVDFWYDEFVKIDIMPLKDAWKMYNDYCNIAGINPNRKMNMQQVRIELENYYEDYKQSYFKDGVHYRSVYFGFRKNKFSDKFDPKSKKKKDESWLQFTSHRSIFDIAYADCPAQLATQAGTPSRKWSTVMTRLQDINTDSLHYVKVPQNHVVIDFDIPGPDGSKSYELNLKEASKWPPTYAELSKSGAGIHLHYIYDGDVSKLSSIYSEHVEVKVFTGNSSLRRKVSKCNELPIATISSGLPFKEDKKVISSDVIENQDKICALIKKALNKEYGSTTQNIHFIHHILEKAYNTPGFVYDVSKYQQKVHTFATNSTNQREHCLELVAQMHFKSEDPAPDLPFGESPITFFDIEVFPNLLLVVWKLLGKEHKCVRMFNPSPKEVLDLFEYRIIGFNNRRYDNHILQARAEGDSIEECYKLSKKLVNSDKNVSLKGLSGIAYGRSYADLYDISSKKQSLKQWEIDFGIDHDELGFDWDKPVPEELWDRVAEYCEHDVIATEYLFMSEEGQADFLAREIISDISGLSINTPNNSHSAAIIFEGNKKPQSEFVYTDLSTVFPGYKFDNGKSTYLGMEIGEGGLVLSKPGMYENVWTFDITSMHPHSIKALNLFGNRYTKRFYDLVLARVYIKRGDFDKAGELFDGKLKKYLKDPSVAKRLSGALKIVINSVYGLTAARFENPFRDPRNIDNIVAKRGALFMATLYSNLIDMGIEVVHVKTDSIKIPNPSEEIKNYIYEFGAKYGYSFEVEDIYKKFCLVNDAVYIAQHEDGTWTATGAQFAQPYVFKTLFSKEPLTFRDKCETKSVKSAIYLDMNEQLGDDHDYKFVGKVGSFCPIKPGYGGGILVRQAENKKTGEIKYDSVTGTKGYRWLESGVVSSYGNDDMIDESYYIALVDAAKDTISQYGDFEMFVS